MTTGGERGAERAALVFRTDVPALTAPAGFVERCAALGVEFEGDDLARLGRFLALLLEANTVVNLTAIKEPEQAWERHIFDALTLMPLLAELGEGARVADVGSGGGVPGVPLAVVMPGLRFTLIEATGKKAAFLRACASALGLGNVEVLCERAETLGQQRGGTGGHREGYDAVLARAVGGLAVVAELTLPLVAPGGRALLVKGQKAEEELESARGAIGVLGGRHAGTVETATGRIVVIEKVSRTPRVYPRRAGVPGSDPLG